MPALATILYLPTSTTSTVDVAPPSRILVAVEMQTVIPVKNNVNVNVEDLDNKMFAVNHWIPVRVHKVTLNTIMMLLLVDVNSLVTVDVKAAEIDLVLLRNVKRYA